MTVIRAVPTDIRSYTGGGEENRSRPRRDRQGDRRGGNRPKTKAAVHRRLGGGPHQHAPPPRPGPDLRQADPGDQSTQRSSPGCWGRSATVSGTYEHAPTETVDVGGTKFAYRQRGPEMRVPVIALTHLRA